MSHTRRDFIKYIVAGSVASGCPIDHALMAEPAGTSSTPMVEGEHFKVCTRCATVTPSQSQTPQGKLTL